MDVFRWFVLLLLVTATGCTTIPIGEDAVFMPKPSVTPASFDHETVQLSSVYFSSYDSTRLNGWYLSQPGAQATVLFFGGNGFYLVQSLGYIRALTQFPVNVFMWDYRGYGNSGGVPSVAAFKRDALAAYDFVRQRYDVPSERLLVHGHSLGTFLATHTAARRDVAGVVLENPATDVRGWVNGLAPWFVRLFIDFEIAPALRDESNLALVRTLDAPLLVVGGTADNITAPEMARTLHAAAAVPRKRLVMIAGGGHNKLYTYDAYTAAYQDFLAPILSGAGEARY
ncbi:alpha/beta hydrolase [Salisaeta longa]|uniref:alpha/beta hydrolase n=1 Tax=Salisaeta longa TaxID=503170 RepID=UPI000417F624|nr:alpha/beta fold hydrolase [Salisaeta longa]